MSSDSRRRLGAITALVVGLFVGLTLLPFPLTGPIGHSLGETLWEWLGAGALGIPLLGIGLALAGFERLGNLDMKRSAFLIVGLSVLLPYLAGVLGHVTVFDIDNGRFLGKMVGALPGFFAVAIPRGIGPAGAVLAGFLALSALTLATFAWHPLQRLERQPEAPAAAKGEIAKGEGRRKTAKDAPKETPEARPSSRWPRRETSRRRRPSPTASRPRPSRRRSPSPAARRATRTWGPSGRSSCWRRRAPGASTPARVSSTSCRSVSRRRWPSSRWKATSPAGPPVRS